MRRDQFPSTQWSLVLIAGEGFSQKSQDALAELCRAYWYPLYAFVRRQDHDPDEAQDLTQAFFTRLLEKKYLRDCDRDRGRFRSFLLASLKHFLSNERDRARAIQLFYSADARVIANIPAAGIDPSITYTPPSP